MLDNVLEIEAAMMEHSMKSKAPLAVMLDFKAAFPSISHEYLHEVLADMGLPEGARRALKHLYHDGRCEIVHGGRRHRGFDMKSGIRQGCPLAPITFAAVMDVFLRLLQHRFGDSIFSGPLRTMWVLSSVTWRSSCRNSKRSSGSSAPFRVWRSIFEKRFVSPWTEDRARR